MLWLLAPIALVLICVLYTLSPAKKAVRVVKEAVNTIESLQAEIDDCRSGCRNDVSAATADLKDDVHRLRLRAISLDELKKHAVGLRLQPLRDVGVRNMEDLQSWGQARLEGLRGVGLKSAATIPGIVQAISLSMKAKPIPDPEPPLARDKERSLVQAIYRELACEHLLAGVPPQFQTLRSEASEAEEHVKVKTRFLKWIWTLGKAEEVRDAITLAQDTARSYQKGNDADRICEQVQALLSACRSVRSNRVDTTTLVEHYNEEWIAYDAELGSSMGNNGRVKRTPPPRLRPAALPEVNAQVLTSAGLQETEPESPDTGQGCIATEPKIDFVHEGYVEEVRSMPQEASILGEPLDESKQQAREQLQKYIDSIAPAKFEREQRSDPDLVSLRVGEAAEPSRFAIPKPLPSRTKRVERWISKDQEVVVQGITLPRGMVFLAKKSKEPEPGVIYQDLEVRPGDLPKSADNMYWNGYAGLTPEQRFHYLQWLADGARSDAHPQFAVHYFQGLERRLVQIADGGGASAADTEKVTGEIRRIVAEFSGFTIPIRFYADRLLNFFAIRQLPDGAPIDMDFALTRSHELPWRLVYDLGRLAKEQRPVSAALAFRWLSVEPNYYARTPATRCPEQFHALFLAAYKARYGEGIILPAQGKTLSFQYQPSNYSLRSASLDLTFEGLPDIREREHLRNELRLLADGVSTQIDAYSRFCGRFPDKADTVQGALLLPHEVWPEPARTTLDELRRSAENIESIEWDRFLGRLGAEPNPSSQLQEIARGLQSIGLGIEPDLLGGARRPKSGELCTLFPLTTAEEPPRTDAAYRNASLAVSLMACVAAVDGHASNTEQATAANIIASWGTLHPDHRCRLQAAYRHQTHQPARLSNLKTRMLSIAQEDRAALLSVLAQMVTSDDVVSAAEVKFLEQVYAMLGVDQAQLYTALHQGNTHAKREANGATASESRATSPSGFALDLGRIEHLKAESAQVSQLLAEVFQEDETAPATTAAQQTKPEQVIAVSVASGSAVIWPSLGPSETAFLALLLTKSEWSRQELSAAASSRKIMLDGTLEAINDASFDVLGEALLDGHDPIYVQTTLLENA